ncbi:MAG: tetratricopeptide repeat protein [Kofleriaceae bacterium]|nr:tetratricopeptide repeat protein [Kofleriaceae bacterium]
MGAKAPGFLTILASCLVLSAAFGCGQRGSEKSVEKSNKRLEIAKDYLQKNDLEGAEGESNKAIALNPNNDEAYMLRGLVSFVRVQQTKRTLDIDNCLTGVDAEATTKDLDMYLAKADQDFEKATKISPDFGEAWANRGIVHTIQEDYGAAVEYLTKALENPMRLVNPSLTRAHLGWAYFYENKLVEAAKELRTALQFNPKMCVATYRLARVYFARQEWEKAAESFEAVSGDATCGSQEASYYLMKTRMQQGLVSEAKNALGACVKISQNSCIATKCRAEGP